MLNPGTHLCAQCGHTFTGFYYHSGVISGKPAELTWDPGTKRFTLRPSDPNDSTVFFLQNPENITTEDFPPETLYALVNTNTKSTEFYRCCKHCGARLKSNWIGLVPGYVIVIMGVPGAGKTSWLGSIATNAMNPLLALDYPYTLDHNNPTGRTEGIAATEITNSDSSNTNYIQVRHKETGEVVALVYLLDYSGESFLPNWYLNNPQDSADPARKAEYIEVVKHLLKGTCGDGYTGLDALMILESAVPTNGSSDLTQDLRIVKGIESPEFPIAYIATHADKLIEQEAVCAQQENRAPIITEKTFPATAYTNETTRALSRHFTPNALADRFHIQHHIAKYVLPKQNLGGQVEQRFLDKTQCFMVKSCVYIEETRKNDYTKQFNTVDPLVWILHQLKLFPLKLEK